MSLQEWETDKLQPAGGTAKDEHRFTLRNRRMVCEGCRDIMNERAALFAKCPGRKLSDAEYLTALELEERPRVKRR